MAESADVNLELVIRVKDLTVQAMARIGQTAKVAGKQVADSFKAADDAIRRTAGANVALGRSASTSGDAMRRMAEAQKVANVASVQAATVLPRVSSEIAKADRATKGWGSSLGALGGLLRRSPLLLLADLASRVAGFNGIMDIFNKTMNTAADALRGLIGLGPAHSESLEQQGEAVSKLTRLYDDLIARQTEQAQANAPLLAGGFDFTEAVSGLEGQKLDAATQFLAGFARRVQELHDRYLREPTLIERALGLSPKQGQSEFARARLEEFREVSEVLSVLRAEQMKQTAETVRSAEATKVAAKAADEWNKRLAEGAKLGDRARQLEAQRAATAALADETYELALAMERAAQVDRAFAEGDAIKRRAEGMKQLAEFTKPLADLIPRIFEGAAEKAREQAEATAFLADETERLQGQADDLLKTTEKQQQSTFGFGFKEVLSDLQNINRFLGQQAAAGTFDAFRGLFRDIASGAKTASEALKDFGRNFVAMLADIFAQKAAAQFLLGLFGGTALGTFFGLEKGGVVPGKMLDHLPIKSYAGGGVADSPQVAIFGEGSARQFGEAFVPLDGNRSIPVTVKGGRGGGGDSFSISLNVGSLDPRTAAEVIMGNIDAISTGVANAIASGRNRSMIAAVRNA